MDTIPIGTLSYKDEYGEHVHHSYGSPYDHKKKIDCLACIAKITEFRNELCEKYGWEEWPEALKGALQGE